MNVLNWLLIVSCASVSLGQLFVGPENVHSVDPQISKQQMTTMENKLARLLDLPAKTFDLQKREKRMIKSENHFLLELYENEHPQMKKFNPTKNKVEHKLTKFAKKVPTKFAKKVDENLENKSNKFFHWARHVRTVRRTNYIATFGCKNQSKHRKELVLKFEPKNLPEISGLVAVELRLFRKPKPVTGERIFQITIGFSNNENDVFNRSLSRIWTENDRGWVVLDVTSLVSEFHDHLQFCISAKLGFLDVSMGTVGISQMDSHVSERPFLVTYFDADLKLKEDENVMARENCRTHRSVEDRELGWSKPDVPSVCTLRILDVNFRALDKFTSVIVPETYQANYCIGECKFPLPENTTNHAIVQALYSSVKATLEPLCAPSKLSALDVIHLDSEDNMVHKTFQEMVVEKCSCQ